MNLEIMTFNKLGQEKLLGTTSVPISRLSPDNLADLSLRVLPNISHKKGTVYAEEDSKLHVRAFYSKLPHHSYAPRINNKINEFLFDIKPQLKTGDLILYNGIGLFPTLVKMIECNNNFTKAGFIVKLPNKWTHKMTYYIAEVDQNLDRFQDAFNESPLSGFTIYRLDERLHQFHGTELWYCPIKEPIEENLQENLVEQIWKFHSGKRALPKGPIPGIFANFISNSFNRMSFEKLQELKYFLNIQSSHLILELFRICGRRVKFTEDEFVSANRLYDNSIYDEPILIRKQVFDVSDVAIDSDRIGYEPNIQDMKIEDKPHNDRSLMRSNTIKKENPDNKPKEPLTKKRIYKSNPSRNN